VSAQAGLLGKLSAERSERAKEIGEEERRRRVAMDEESLAHRDRLHAEAMSHKVLCRRALP
jgi:hypothetical protein